MPQHLLLLALSGAGLVFARKLYLRERERIAAELRRTEEMMRQRASKPRVTLVRDPLTGIYAPPAGDLRQG